GVCTKALFKKGMGPDPQLGGGRGQVLPEDCVEPVERLLTIPLRTLGLRVLELTEYVDLMSFLPWWSQKQVRRN
ncbi:unnamed protein product, partial [Discosporangium mesarthrocarpum]